MSTDALFDAGGYTADISADGLYRYSLGRQWDAAPGASVLWVMLNPSTADASINDRTMDRVVSFSKGFGYRRCQVVNLYAWRATKAAELRQVEDPVGPENDAAIALAAREATTIVCAWGTNPFYRERAEAVVAILDANALRGSSRMCLGKTKNGDPKHPLYVLGETELQPFWLPANASR